MTRRLLLLALLAGSMAACSGGTDGTGVKSEAPAKAGVGDACRLQNDCRLPLDCLENLCQPVGETAEGAACTVTGECSEGLYCDTLTSVCAPAGTAGLDDACNGTSECEPGLVCGPKGFSAACVPAGTLDAGAECEAYYDCLPGLGCGRRLNQLPDEPAVCLSGPESLPVPWIGVQCPVDDGDPAQTALFNVPGGDDDGTFYELPYPNDMRLIDGHPNLADHPTPGPGILGFDIVKTYLDRISAEQDHFGLNPSMLFRFDGRLDFETISAGGDSPNIYFVALTPGSPFYGEQRSLSWQASTASGSYLCNNWIALRPSWGRPLEPRTTYAAVMTTAIRADGGGAINQSTDFRAMLGADPPPEPHLRTGWDSYEPLRAWMADQNVDGASLLNAAVFTTGDPRILTGALRETAREHDNVASALTLCDEGVTSPCEDGLEGDEHKRGCFAKQDGFSEIHGKLSLPVFQEGAPPYLEEGGAISVSGGRPALVRSEDVCMAMTVPDGDAPEAGWPVLIYAHGTGGSFRGFANQVSGQLSAMEVDETSTGMIVVGWDQVLHFTRRGDSEADPEGLVYNFANPDAATGNFVQGAAELHALVDFVEQLNIPAESSPTGNAIVADPSKIYFMGHSQGGTTGPIALPYEPNVQGAVLSGAGAGLTHALLGKTSPVDIPNAVRVVLQDPNIYENHPVISLLQQYFEPVDPGNYAQYIGAKAIDGVTTRKHVLHSVGVGDTYTPKLSLETMATALRLGMIRPYEFEQGFVNETDLPAGGNISAGGETYSVLGRQYETDGTYDGHFVLFQHPQGRDDVVEFFGTAIVRGVPEIAD